MLGQVSTLRALSRTAVTVMNGGSKPVLCPFFGKCDGLLLFDGQSEPRKFLPNMHRTAEAVSQLILIAKPDRLICGFIGEPEKQKLRKACIDVRLGSLTYTVDELVACFCDLPPA